MAERDVIQNSISQLGQSQSERDAAELRTGFVNVDERTSEELLGFAQRLARRVEYYRYDPVTDRAMRAGDWQPFFEHGPASPGELLAASDGSTPPQLALFLAFLHLYEQARATLNTFTDRQLEFYYQRVLGFALRPAVPDRAHVVFELKKNTAPVQLLPTHMLSADRDAAQVERLYQPVREMVINRAKIDRLHTIHVDPAGRGTIRVAPVAKSSDGVGGPLPKADPRFAPFGSSSLPPGEIGFAIASPILRMRDGQRKVTLSLELASALPPAITDGALGAAFDAFVTGEKQWLGPHGVTATREDRRVNLSFTVPDSARPVIGLDAAVHGHAYATDKPVAQLLLRPGASIGYRDLAALVVTRLGISVEVTGATAVFLESDAGKVDPKKKFAPFGTQPTIGSCFFVGIPEVLAKPLTALTLAIDWHGLPGDLPGHYVDYDTDVARASFTVATRYRDGSGCTHERAAVRLFADSGSRARLDLLLAEPPRALPNPMLAPGQDVEQRFVPLTLNADFLHETYRRKTIENALDQTKRNGKAIVLNLPYTPTIAGLTIDYTARAPDTDIASTELADFADAAVQLFHVDAFGQRREHGYLRSGLDAAQRSVPLLPAHPDEGELLVGIAGIGPGESVSILFQISEGSADPDVVPSSVAWSVLCNNHWKQLGSDELVLDTTDRFMRSGLVCVVLSPIVTTDNTLLPSQRVWLKAAIARDTAAASRMLDVIANAAEVEFVDHGNQRTAADSPLPAGKIAKLKTPIPAIKSVAQPYASLDGRPRESPIALVTRASERLRHKRRCITPWDYERVVLEAFPHVHRVKCVPHARRDGTWTAPGHVLLVVIPDLRNDHVRDPLRPRMDAGTLEAIAAHVKRLAGDQVIVDVNSPSYQNVRLDFKVKFLRGREPEIHLQLLKRELTAFLSPWAFDAHRPISFGGVVYRSVLLDFVEERDYVDYATDFKMYSYTGTASFGPDLVEVQARTPDAILVSDAAHDVAVIGR